MLAKEVITGYGDQVQFVSEDWGSSSLAERFGIKRYPVVFVNDVLLARPEDFGWFGAQGRYTPWLEGGNHEKFKRDLARIIDLELRGDTEGARQAGSSTQQSAELEALPKLKLQDLHRRGIDTAALGGRVLIVEFWATWCLPCHATLPWLGELKRRYGERIEVLAVAVESEESEVRKLVRPMNLPYPVIQGNPQVATSFGDITSVPTMFIFDAHGQTSAVFYGAPNDLHDKVGRKLDSLLGEK